MRNIEAPYYVCCVYPLLKFVTRRTCRRLWAVCCAEDVQQGAEDDASHRRLERGIQAIQPPGGGPCQATHIHQVGAHCNENPIYVFLFWELCGLSPNFPILSVSDSYIPRISSHISCSTTARSTVGIHTSLTDT